MAGFPGEGQRSCGPLRIGLREGWRLPSGARPGQSTYRGRGRASPGLVLAGSCGPGRLGLIYNHMVVSVLEARRDDRLLHALSDATRRDIVRRTLVGSHSVSELARAYPMSFAAVQKHVAVLERAGLVSKERRGREQLVHAEITRLRAAARVLEEIEAMWRGRIDRIDGLLAEPAAGAHPPDEGTPHARHPRP